MNPEDNIEPSSENSTKRSVAVYELEICVEANNLCPWNDSRGMSGLSEWRRQRVWVFDIDETLLSNLPYYVSMVMLSWRRQDVWVFDMMRLCCPTFLTTLSMVMGQSKFWAALGLSILLLNVGVVFMWLVGLQWRFFVLVSMDFDASFRCYVMR
ncbi:hypothetical protein F3Y22_tig00112988pilonHSYRG00174 [Hibiscus syriacus]|uniref:Uncharacterized protein n=1 Tax=Hibiscus syriacus TaxID=106335 RepID=A0A6A2X842_HIBSY|nr:hypothetical protein F3Y22_tig00112988pilonHSYRG00174 [Hibiscus syriacus]